MRCSCCGTSTRSAFTGFYDFTKALLIRPRVAYFVAGKVNSSDKLYLVIESVRRTSTTSGPPLFLFLLTAREGQLSSNPQVPRARPCWALALRTQRRRGCVC